MCPELAIYFLSYGYNPNFRTSRASPIQRHWRISLRIHHNGNDIRRETLTHSRCALYQIYRMSFPVMLRSIPGRQTLTAQRLTANAQHLHQFPFYDVPRQGKRGALCLHLHHRVSHLMCWLGRQCIFISCRRLGRPLHNLLAGKRATTAAVEMTIAQLKA